MTTTKKRNSYSVYYNEPELKKVQEIAEKLNLCVASYLRAVSLNPESFNNIKLLMEDKTKG